MDDESFENTILGKLLLRTRNNPEMVNKMNDFVAYSYQDIWIKTGKNNPFIEDDISIALFMKANIDF